MQQNHQRRQIIAAAAATFAVAALPPRASPQAATNPRRIDVHHHFMPQKYLERARAGLIAGSPYGAQVVQWTPAASLEQMDRWGIATAVLSNPGVGHDFPDQQRDLVRDSNEFAARMREDHRGRFGVFAAVPMSNIDDALKEIDYAYGALNADGIQLCTSYGDKWPGDPAFDPVLEELNRRRAVVFIHPVAPGCCGRLIPGIPAPTVEFMFDVTRCITSLLFRGSFTRFPGIRFIFTHDGATVPMLADRITRNSTVVKSTGVTRQQTALDILKRLHYDVTTSTSKPALAAVRAFVPVTQLLFGSDFPYLDPGDTVPGLEAAGFGPHELAMINRGNTEKLFGRRL